MDWILALHPVNRLSHQKVYISRMLAVAYTWLSDFDVRRREP